MASKKGSGIKRKDTHGAQTMETLARISQKQQTAEVKRSLELGLEAADSVIDRSISLFSRGHQPAFAGINTFMKAPYCEDIRKVGDYEACFVGAPFDSATTYRPGTRFGPQAVRRISALYDGYWFDGGVDIYEELDFCDGGDIFVIPGNIEKTFDQVTKAVSHIYTSGAFPIICGGDHSLGFPNVRGIAPHIDGNVGIIHIDRHIDIQEKDMDERMHTTPWFWTTNEGTATTHRNHSRMHEIGLANCHPKNLVQMGIGGWYGNRPGTEVARKRGTSVMTMHDIEKMGAKKAAEVALEMAWEGCKAVYLSYDIDSHRSGLRAGNGIAGAGGPSAPRSLRDHPHDRRRRLVRHGGGGGLAALRRQRQYSPARLPRRARRARHARCQPQARPSQEGDEVSCCCRSSRVQISVPRKNP